MSTLDSVGASSIRSAATEPAPPIDAETLARRALGIAINSLWGGAAVAPLPPVPQALARAAETLVRERVPACRERELALELLSRDAPHGGPS